MPTIYRWTEAITVNAQRYAELLALRPTQYFAVATVRPVLDKPVDVAGGVLNLNQYGGVDATGAQDMTQVLQTAMNTAASVGVALQLPPGLFMCGQLTVPNGLVMRGYSPNGTGTMGGKETRLGFKAGVNAHWLTGAVGSANVRISGIHFDGNKNNNTSGDIIHIDPAGTPEEGQWHIRDCFMDAAAGYGIYVGAGRRAVQISDSSVCYSRLSGIYMAGSDGHIDRCIIGSNLEHGIGVAGTVCNVNDCDIYGNGTVGNSGQGDGISVFSTITMASIRGNRIDQNKRHGVLISGSCEAITVTGNMFHGNSQLANGTHNDVLVLSTAGSNTVANNVFGVDGNVSNKPGYAVALGTSVMLQGRDNVVQSGAVVSGITNAPKRFAQTRDRLADWAPASALYTNMNRADAVIGNVAGLLTSGKLYLAGGLMIPAGVPISSISFLCGNTAPGTPLNQWFCLVDQSLNVLAKTVDDTTTAWSGNSYKTLNLSSTFIRWTDTPVYVGLMLVATTMPDLRAANASNVPYQALPAVCGQPSNTGLTNPASLGSTVGTMTAGTANPLCYVS